MPTCSGPLTTRCTSCKLNACTKKGKCPEGVVFKGLLIARGVSCGRAH